MEALCRTLCSTLGIGEVGGLFHVTSFACRGGVCASADMAPSPASNTNRPLRQSRAIESEMVGAKDIFFASHATLSGAGSIHNASHIGSILRMIWLPSAAWLKPTFTGVPLFSSRFWAAPTYRTPERFDRQVWPGACP